MAIRKIYNLNYKGVSLKSGHFYSFERYDRYENDPSPMILFMYALQGVHPNTGHFHSYIQAWNLSYIPKRLRKQTIQQFIKLAARLETGGYRQKIRVTHDWFPAYLDVAVRRYLTRPPGLIKGVKEIPFEFIEQALADIEHKDYSKIAIMKKARQLVQRNMFRVKAQTKAKARRKRREAARRRAAARK